MKRLLAVLLITALALSILPCALAEDTCKHENTSTTTYTYDTPFSVIRHKTYADVLYCVDCGKTLKSHQHFEKHIYDEDGICEVCGALRPEKAQLIARAWEMLPRDIDLRNCWTIYSAAICDAPSGNPTGDFVAPNGDYRIIAHDSDGDVIWVQICENLKVDEPLGWIPTSCAYVQGGMIGADAEEGDWVTIIVSSGRARQEPGDSPIVDYVRYGEHYEVYGVATGTNGKPWYQIKRGNTLCWISAGLTTYGWKNLLTPPAPVTPFQPL